MSMKIIKIALAILFFLCLLHMPYGYFQLVHILGLVGFTVLAYQASEKQDKTEVIIYVGLAILFQPFIKISLGRHVWNIVDVIIGIALLMSLFSGKENKQAPFL